MPSRAEPSDPATPSAAPRDGSPQAPFNIRLWFAVVSFVVIGALGGTFGYLMSEFFARRLMHREAEVTQEFLQSIIVAEHTARDIFRPETPDWRDSLESFTDHMVGLPGVFRANMYSMDRRIVWSTDAEMIDRRFEGNTELEIAFRGTLFAEVNSISEITVKAEHEALRLAGSRRFIEAYIPMREAGGELVGVVELYKSPAALEATIRSAQEMIWASVAVGAIILYGALYWVVRRGAQVIERQQQQLMTMETMAALGQMAGAIAHSLRNPLAGLRSSAELVAAGDMETAKDASRTIISEADRMDRHIRDLLSYTRTERLSVQPVDPFEVARSCITDARTAIERRRIEVSFIEDAGSDRRIAADSVMLRQAISSVVSNALEAMPEGGHLRVKASGGASSGRIALAISDNGRGMLPEILSQVATPFFTTKAQGLGLGLALARRIAERYDGTLRIDSTVGHGTTVTFEFAALR